MNLIELAEEIKKVVIELDNEEVDIDKIKNLLAVLKKLIIKFRERAFLSDLSDLYFTIQFLSNYENEISFNVSRVWKYLYEVVIEISKDEYIDFNIPGESDEEELKKGF